MEQQEVLYVKTLGNQTQEIVSGIESEDPSIDISIVHESLEAVCLVLKKDSTKKIDVARLCDTILKEDAIHYRTYWQVNVGTRKVNPIKKRFTKPIVDKPNKFNIKKTNTSEVKTNTISLAWKIL